MKFTPPIESRTDEEIVKICHYPNEWVPEAVEQAKKELIKRGITQETQSVIISRWENKLAAEAKYETKRRAMESYSLFDSIYGIINLPGTILTDWHLKRDGYNNMHKQRLYIIGYGILFYFFFFIYLNYQLKVDEHKIQEEIEKVDISEWERAVFEEKSDTLKAK